MAVEQQRAALFFHVYVRSLIRIYLKLNLNNTGSFFRQLRLLHLHLLWAVKMIIKCLEKNIYGVFIDDYIDVDEYERLKQLSRLDDNNLRA